MRRAVLLVAPSQSISEHAPRKKGLQTGSHRISYSIPRLPQADEAHQCSRQRAVIHLGRHDRTTNQGEHATCFSCTQLNRYHGNTLRQQQLNKSPRLVTNRQRFLDIKNTTPESTLPACTPKVRCQDTEATMYTGPEEQARPHPPHCGRLTVVDKCAAGSTGVIKHAHEGKHPDANDVIGSGVIPQSMGIDVDAAGELHHLVHITSRPCRELLHNRFGCSTVPTQSDT